MITGYFLSENQIPHACLPPSEEEMEVLTRKIKGWNLFTEQTRVAIIMKHFRGKCNPAIVREFVKRYQGIR